LDLLRPQTPVAVAVVPEMTPALKFQEALADQG
jgi:hypothetical protein